MSTKRGTAERDEAIADLRKILKPGDTVYTILRHRSRSGMLRVIDVQVIQDNEPRWIGYLTHKATGISYDNKREGLRVGGCGMDMGFHVVYELSSVLFPEYECIGDRCPHDKEPRGIGVFHTTGGYALRHRWM